MSYLKVFDNLPKVSHISTKLDEICTISEFHQQETNKIIMCNKRVHTIFVVDL